MSVLSGETLTRMAIKGSPIVTPFVFEKTIFNGMSYGCSVAGYDIRIKEEVKWDTVLLKSESGFHHRVVISPFRLASSVERFKLPKNVMGFVHDKSSGARKGLSLFNTVIEPGWEGYLTIEMLYVGSENLIIPAGSPIAQIIFMYTDQTTEGYAGKYQNQAPGPVEAIFENTPETHSLPQLPF